MNKTIPNYMGFDKMFWGFLFLFSIRIQGIDLLPEAIGYLLFYLGLQQLDTVNKHFESAKKLAFSLIFVSLVTFYEFPDHTSVAVSQNVFVLVLGVLNLTFVYLICRGIREMSQENNLPSLSERSQNIWIFYLIVKVSVLIFIAISLFISYAIGILNILMVILLVLSVVSIVLLMTLMRQCDQSFS